MKCVSDWVSGVLIDLMSQFDKSKNYIPPPPMNQSNNQSINRSDGWKLFCHKYLNVIIIVNYRYSEVVLCNHAKEESLGNLFLLNFCNTCIMYMHYKGIH